MKKLFVVLGLLVGLFSSSVSAKEENGVYFAEGFEGIAKFAAEYVDFTQEKQDSIILAEYFQWILYYLIIRFVMNLLF